eukprot:gene12501-30479_t
MEDIDSVGHDGVSIKALPKAYGLYGGYTPSTGVKRGDPCTIPGCKSKVIARAVCRRHGALGQCQSPGCDSWAMTAGHCQKHKPNKKFRYCSFDGCNSHSRLKGFCDKHSNNVKMCMARACTAVVMAKGMLCAEHKASSSGHVQPAANVTNTTSTANSSSTATATATSSSAAASATAAVTAAKKKKKKPFRPKGSHVPPIKGTTDTTFYPTSPPSAIAVAKGAAAVIMATPASPSVEATAAFLTALGKSRALTAPAAHAAPAVAAGGGGGSGGSPAAQSANVAIAAAAAAAAASVVGGTASAMTNPPVSPAQVSHAEILAAVAAALGTTSAAVNAELSSPANVEQKQHATPPALPGMNESKASE